MDTVSSTVNANSFERVNSMSYDTMLDKQILNIVQTQEIREQSELQQALKDRGYEIPQATLSRRLKKLTIVKISGFYKSMQAAKTNLPTVLNMQVSDFGMIIMHTHPGHANSLAFFLDQQYVSYSIKDSKNSGILGTIAGDDTVLIIVKNKEALTQIISCLSTDFPYLKIS